VPGGAAAVCVPDGTEARTCASDTECSGIERCQCGRCIVQACDAGTVCPAGQACRGGRCTGGCTQDTECDGGDICNGGGCTHPCNGDGDCLHGEVCDFLGVCAAQACGPDASCGAGSTCEPLAVDGDVREPTFATVGDETFLFFELRSRDSSAVYRARIDTPLHLTADPETPVLSPPDGHTRVGAPSALVREGTVELIVAVGSGDSLGLATSSDGGRTFSWTSDTALVAAEPWENGWIGAPAVFEREGTTLVLYEGGPGAGIGLAMAQDGVLTRLSPAPVLTAADLEDASFWRSMQSIGSPFVLLTGDTTRVYVNARGIEAGTAVTQSGPVAPVLNDSVGLFATTDLDSFDRFPTGPIYSATSGLFGSLGEREPAIRITDDGADLYFVATDASGAQSTGLSRASTVR